MGWLNFKKTRQYKFCGCHAGFVSRIAPHQQITENSDRIQTDDKNLQIVIFTFSEDLINTLAWQTSWNLKSLKSPKIRGKRQSITKLTHNKRQEINESQISLYIVDRLNFKKKTRQYSICCVNQRLASLCLYFPVLNFTKSLAWLAHVTVWLQVPNHSQLSYYTVRLQLCRLISAKWFILFHLRLAVIVRYPRFPSSILCRYCDLCSLELKDQLLGQGQLNVSDARISNFLQSASKLLYLILDLKVSMGNHSRRLPFWTNLFWG